MHAFRRALSSPIYLATHAASIEHERRSSRVDGIVFSAARHFAARCGELELVASKKRKDQSACESGLGAN